MKTVSLLAGVVLLFPVSLSAESDTQKEFNAMDLDRNGVVTILEAEGNVELLKQWATVDKDSNGELELSEFSAFEIGSPVYVQDEDENEATIGAGPR